MRFKGKTVLITGGAGGIGKAAVRIFAKEGARIFISLSQTGDASIKDEIENQGGTLEYLRGDLSGKSFCEDLVEQTLGRFGTIDILVNNAGVIPRGDITQTTDEMWFQAMDINLTAVFYLCRAAVPPMAAKGGGAIVNVSSTWGLYPGPGHLAYCTSKGALLAFTRNLARDHAKDRIIVNAVCPNEVNTPMLRSGFEKRGLDPDKAVDQLNESVPIGRIAEPEDVADVIAFLASDASRYMTGSVLEVSGAKPVG